MKASSSILIRGAEVYDGSGAEPSRLDVLVVDGRIRLVSDRTAVPSGVPTLDGAGLALAPGFIDVHTHSDALALMPDADPELSLAPVRQGVTVEIAGNCGSSLFPPAQPGTDAVAMESFIRTLFGDDAHSVEGAEDFERLQMGVDRKTNIVSLVGHSTLRGAVLGFGDCRPTPAQLDQMCSLLGAALRAGAAGLSSGLIYPPGTFADTDELVALARVAAAHGRPYVTHLRDEMSNVEAALDEAIDVARASGVALHVSHHKTAGTQGHGRTVSTLATMDAARASGVDLTCDVYPYTASSTHLHAMFPPWATAGGIPALLERLRSGAEVRDAVRRSIAVGEEGWENTVGNGGWDLIEVATAPGRSEAEGRSIAGLAQAAGVDPVDYAADLLLAEQAQVTIISRSMAEDDVRRVLSHPGTMIGSDGVPHSGRPHPRWAGSFARVLGRYSRDAGLLTLADAVSRMTALPARRFGLRGRGVIAEGAHADLVLFDPAEVLDRATFATPLDAPRGIHHVFVNGQRVIADGSPTGASPGRPLRVQHEPVGTPG
ncbi:N-acyl-D-amino-acid deacylase family protein [Pimelobacter simplex]|uniref:N-acyl-D-amino-acid deacylase family protein n=1 Tax=Nocardioides simplex TaxID=2045 RepID=UPI0019328610|nr:amidohydrolase family protein [Pimelobacter simplex]